LPAEHEYTQTLLGLGYLTRVEAPELPPPPPPAETKDTPADAPKKPQGKKGAAQ